MAGGRGTHPHQVHRAVLELGETILAEPDVLRILKSAAEVVAKVIKTDIVAILGLGSDQRSMRVLAAAGVDAATAMKMMGDQPDPLSLEAMRSDRIVVVRDLSRDRRFSSNSPSPSGGGKGGGLLSGITTTINRSQQVFGVLTGRSKKPRAFTAVQFHLVEDTAALLSRTLTRRDAERNLRESEERFRLLAERSPDVIVLTRLLPEPRLEYISPSIENLTGYSAEHLLHAEDRTSVWAIIHPDDLQKSLAYISNPLAEVQPLMVRFIHRDGSIVWMEQRFTPIFDNGVLVAIEGVIRGVTHRVLSEQRRQAQSEVTQLILEGRHADEILLAVAGHLSRLSGADYALFALPATGLGWAVRTIGGDTAQEVHEVVMPPNDPLIARVGAGTAAVMIDDLSMGLPMDHALKALGWSGSALLAPIRGSNGLLGVLGIANVAQGRGFSDIGAAGLGDFARQAALAIEYGRAREELQRLAVLEDRARISRELHDGVIQSLFGVGMMLEGIRETEEVSPPTRDSIARVAQMIDNIMVDVRSYIFDLRPSVLTGRNVEQGLRLLAEDFEKASSIPCTVDLDPDALRELEGAAPQLIQIVREALSNVARHSGASRCWLEVHRIRRNIVVEIRDDGRGFKPVQAASGRGLENIRRRVDEMGARLELVSEPRTSPSPSAKSPSPARGGGSGWGQGGTSVRVSIPTTRVLSSKRTASPRTAAGAKVEA